MRNRKTTAMSAAVLAGAMLLGTALAARAADEVYAPPAPAKLKAMTLQWVAAQKPSAAVRRQVDALWADVDGLSPRAGFQKVIETFVLVRPDARQLVESCRLVNAPLSAPKAEDLLKGSAGDFYTANMRLYYGRYLAQRRMYDEALSVLQTIEPQQVVDPATCLFYRAVCEHQLLMKKEGLATINRLLKNTEQVPVSYSNVAILMQDELQQMRNGVSLKKIALKMRDSERRLDLARGGQRVQKLQGEIIADLDELIEKLEQQSGGGQCACEGGNTGKGQKKSSSPAKDSRILGGKGEGNVDPKTVKKNDKGWGNLPSKKIAEAKSAINRKLPPHYARLIEAYKKKIAGRKVKAEE